MKLTDFDYHLPKELIAQEGLPQRDLARLMVLCADGRTEHKTIQNLPEFFRKGDLLIMNDARVSPAKLLGKKTTGGKVDCLVLPPAPGNGSANGLKTREALLRGGRIRPGTVMQFHKGAGPQMETLEAKVVEKIKGSRFKIEFDRPEQVESFGILPLPHYIKKDLAEPERYQTVYSKKQGSLAAPTAGLHFTPGLMKTLTDAGVEFAFLTLHIGIGTFAPIRAENVEDWKMHPEYYQVSPESAEKINRALGAGQRCFAVGTTSVRTLETATMEGRVKAGEGWTDIYLYPGYNFKFPYSGLLTNFHLPQSTLLLLASAFAGRERILSAYAEAVREKYRFFSLGDSMLILK